MPPLIDMNFERDLIEFHENRMYPPINRKEYIMQKPTQRHIGAIIRTQYVLKTGIKVDSSRELIHEIEKDIGLLSEVRQILHWLVDHPQLPFIDLQPETTFQSLHPTLKGPA